MKSLGLEPSLRRFPPLMVYSPRAFMFEDKPCEKSLGLEPSFRAGSSRFVYCTGPICLRTYHVRSPCPEPSLEVPSTLMVYCALGLYV